MITLIIADDFTGSNDTGAQLVKKGIKVNVLFDWTNQNTLNNEDNSKVNDVIVVNTDSRAISTDKAKKRIKEVIRSNVTNRYCYKKIDSTIRGNVGIEIETLLENTQYKAALVIPAFPNMNRITKNGKCYVNGVELIHTEFATDPKTPIYSSQIKSCIMQQTTYKCEEIYLDTVRSHNLRQEIEKQLINNTKIVVIDAENNDDLKNIINQISPIKEQLLLVGSAGLIDFLPISNYKITSTILKNESKPLLVIAGSMSETTQQQINYTLVHGDNCWGIIDIDISTLVPQLSPLVLEQYRNNIQNILNNNQNCIIRTCLNASDRHKIETYCQQYNLTRTELGEKICQSLGQIANQLHFHNLFLTGGDVAIAVAKSLGAIGFTIEGEVSSGVPYGRLISQQDLHYRVFTKAGGFGTQDIFLKSLEFI